MAKLAAVVVCAAGVVAVTLLAGSPAFTTGLRVKTPPGSASPQQFVGRAEAPEVSIGVSAAPLSVGVAIGLAAATLAAVHRGLVARRFWPDVGGSWFEQQMLINPVDPKLKAQVEAEVKGTELAIPLPKGVDPWVDDYESIAWTPTGPQMGPVAGYRQGVTVYAGGLVGSEYAGFGTYKFDPLNLANRYPEHLPWYREAELKHGRVCMLACVGLVAPDGFRLPFPQCSDPSLDMLTSHNKLIGPGLGEGPMWWLLIACGVIESIRFKQVGLGFGELTLENAGDQGFGKGFLPKTKEGQVQMQIKELKNGRLAMLAFSGAITQGIAWETHHFPFVPTN